MKVKSIIVTNIDTGEEFDATDWLYHFEEIGLQELGGSDHYGHKHSIKLLTVDDSGYKRWVELKRA